MGRPPKAPEERKGGNLTIRLRGGAREMVEKAVEATQRRSRKRSSTASCSPSNGNRRSATFGHGWPSRRRRAQRPRQATYELTCPARSGRRLPAPSGARSMSIPRALNRQTSGARRGPTQKPDDDLEAKTYRAVQRALRDARDPELTP